MGYAEDIENGADGVGSTTVEQLQFAIDQGLRTRKSKPI